MNWDQSDVTVTGKETLKSLLSSCNDVRTSRLDGQFSQVLSHLSIIWII